jgi:hypothetical protein
VSDLLYLNGIQSFTTFLSFKLYFVVLLNLSGNAGNVYKEIFFGVVISNEAVTFLFIKEFYCSCFHKEVKVNIMR